MPSKAQTKFPALAVGQRFVWRGQRFVKTSPLLACAEDGGRSQMIPRSAVVEPTGAKSDAAPIATDALRQALEELRRAAQTHVDALAAGATTQKAARARKDIEAAYRYALRLLAGQSADAVDD